MFIIMEKYPPTLRINRNIYLSPHLLLKTQMFDLLLLFSIDEPSDSFTLQ